MKRKLMSFCAFAVLLAGCAATEPAAEQPLTKEQAQAELWPMELAIYSARGKGSLDPYINATADDYAAWPPGFPAPTNADDLRSAKDAMSRLTEEELEMEFVSLVLDGDTAVIYYKTHRTRRPDGTEVDERFNVTHTWVKRGEDWKILGGMARPVPQ